MLQDRCFDRALPARLSRTGYSFDPQVVLDTDAKGLRYWPADLKNFPARIRGPVLECEAQFTTSDVENHLISFGEYCAMYLAVWSNAVWELKPDGKPALATIDEVYAVPPDAAAAALGAALVLREGGRRDHADRRDEARRTASRSCASDEDEQKGFARATADADGLLRLAAARAARARERADVHGRRRPRRDRRLEPRPRVARPRVHLARSDGASSPRRSSPTSPSRTGATTRCATAPEPYRRLL